MDEKQKNILKMIFHDFYSANAGTNAAIQLLAHSLLESNAIDKSVLLKNLEIALENISDKGANEYLANSIKSLAWSCFPEKFKNPTPKQIDWNEYVKNLPPFQEDN